MDTSTSSSKPTPDDTELPDGGGSEFLNPCFHYIDCKDMILKCFNLMWLPLIDGKFCCASMQNTNFLG